MSEKLVPRLVPGFRYGGSEQKDNNVYFDSEVNGVDGFIRKKDTESFSKSRSTKREVFISRIIPAGLNVREHRIRGDEEDGIRNRRELIKKTEQAKREEAEKKAEEKRKKELARKQKEEYLARKYVPQANVQKIQWVTLQAPRYYFLDTAILFSLMRKSKLGIPGSPHSIIYDTFSKRLKKGLSKSFIAGPTLMTVNATGVIPSQKNEFGTFVRATVAGKENFILPNSFFEVCKGAVSEGHK